MGEITCAWLHAVRPAFEGCGSRSQEEVGDGGGDNRLMVRKLERGSEQEGMGQMKGKEPRVRASYCSKIEKQSNYQRNRRGCVLCLCVWMCVCAWNNGFRKPAADKPKSKTAWWVLHIPLGGGVVVDWRLFTGCEP